jgi:hypothetical protein
MGLFNPIRNDIIRIYKLVTSLDQTHYVQPVAAMLGSTIGEHVAQILEFYSCILQTSNENLIIYAHREQNPEVETNPDAAILLIHGLLKNLNAIVVDKKVLVQKNYSEHDGEEVYLSSSLFRELAHALDHSVHHQAIVTIALTAKTRQSEELSGFTAAHEILRLKTDLTKNHL